MDKALAQQLYQWFNTELGKSILQYEQEKLNEKINNLFGYLAVQLGMPSVDFLAENRIRHKWIVASFDNSCATYPAPYVQGISGRIPLEDHSTDLILLPHTLELHKNPTKLLEDVHRVLVHNGHAVIIGFNPNHLWGLRRLYKSAATSPIPYHRLISQYRIKNWFKLLDFEIVDNTQKTDKKPLKLNYWQFIANNPWLAKEGAFYILVAKKRTLGLHLIGPALKKNQHKNIIVVTQQVHKK
ncbi:class I SAM-dependent methyltransferase [Pelistega sp. NLN82]|uniref:Class I SAM-dependent methyltransferase n=1 Tax=Pelistega ratti TaxID=2652177 RepID=A0A6L9Y351_9BURK|nr:methyltransferase domain-containing protein [Pelistega ratti]NEN74772.1 class I SAM-dependent methyltransferase [Pelistega ratti]